MLYRPLGQTGERVSALGFGCMRLPILDGHYENIDVPMATQMLHYAIDAGVNYVDTAYPYHSAGMDGRPGASEPFLGKALEGGHRDKVMIATKLPLWRVGSRQDMDEILDGQLKRLRTDRIDCYLLHAAGAERFESMKALGVLEFLDEAKREGKIRFAGFSFHDESQAFAPIVDAYGWDFCQIQYNYMDVDYQAGEAGLAYAADRGLGVVIMEPLKGGRLAAQPPADVQALWDAAPVKRSPAAWGLRFVWNDARSSCVLSGMSTMEQMRENVALAAEAHPASLSEAELKTIELVQQAYGARAAVDCTACRYCQPCPEGIDIPMLFGFLNNAALYDTLDEDRRSYGIEVEAGHTGPASACSECGQCVEACPQQLEIIDELKKVAGVFDRGA